MEVGDSRRDGVIIDLQLMTLSELRTTRVDLFLVAQRVNVIETQVQKIENLLGENHSRTKYIMYSTFGMVVLQSVYLLLIIIIKARNWGQITSHDWKEFQNFRRRSPSRNRGHTSYIVYLHQRHRVNDQTPHIESGD